MPVYRYKGFDSTSGAARKGTIEAESTKAARSKLKTRDKIVATEVTEQVSVEKLKGKASFLSSLTGGGVKAMDVAIMTRQFATLQEAHLPLDETLKALSRQVESEPLRNALQQWGFSMQ